MWGNLAAITFFAGVFVPTLWLLTILFVILDWRSDRKDSLTARARTVTPPIENSHPGVCPACGAMDWNRSELRIVPAVSIRRAPWLTGNAATTTFRCRACGGFGRYARSYVQPEQGWIMLDRWAGGW
jgi:hypothetical protein